MKHMAHVRVGTYALTDDLTIGIRTSDDGTVLTIREQPSGKTTTATINELGNVVGRSNRVQVTHRTSTADSEPSSPSPVPPSEMTSGSRIEILDRVLKSVPKQKKGKPIRFILKYGRTSHRHRPRALAAFTDGVVTHVLYQISRDPAQRHLRIDVENVQIELQIKETERLSQAEWSAILKMPESTNFAIKGRLGLFWKLKADELRELSARRH